MGEIFETWKNNPTFAPNCMPLEELPIPVVLDLYLRTHMPFGYSGGGGKLNYYNMNYTRTTVVVAQVFDAPDGPELMLRWFACRNTNKDGFEITEIMRKSPAEDYCYYRNMYYRTMCGWQYIYKDQEKRTRGGYYGYNYTLWEKGWFNKWRPEALKNAPGISAPWINPELVNLIPRYRFSGWKPKCGLPVIEYLQKYNANNGIEFFGKLGINPTKSLIAKATKDGNFRRFLRDHANDASIFGSTVTLYAYKHRVPFEEAFEEINGKARAAKKVNNECWNAKAIPRNIDRRRIWEYASKVGPRSYNDYIAAVEYLQLDLTDTKVIFPNDFKRMHDLRINQMTSHKAKAEAKKAKEFAKKFAEAAGDYFFANYTPAGAAYCIVIPDDNAQLVAEGKALHHCVGKMGYDNKMIQHTSFIAFLRKADEIEKPFVTIEFGIESKRIVQIYGAHDKRPTEDVIEWAKVWEESVRKIIEQAKKAIGKAAAQGKKEKSIFEYIREHNLAA